MMRQAAKDVLDEKALEVSLVMIAHAARGCLRGDYLGF